MIYKESENIDIEKPTEDTVNAELKKSKQGYFLLIKTSMTASKIRGNRSRDQLRDEHYHTAIQMTT